ncbi:MAG: bifunctional 5,10-methylenetetrahydrofolate dehydrogenase/5,10-methenyltetrahydrofolate cyclohydrolase [Candidatus Gastranaerophilales bacterium]
MTTIIDGKALRDRLLDELKIKIDTFKTKPTLVVILVGNDPASQIYVNNKKKTAEKLGINSEIIQYQEDVLEDVLLDKINDLNNNVEVTGILVQLPLPKHINKSKVINAILPSKDVDGFTPENFGKLFAGEKPYVYPCTPKGILLLLDEYNINLQGKHAVIIGRSNIVGKPLIQMLLARDATVTTCHSKTTNLEKITKTADILISAVGEKIIHKNMIKKNCIIIDVGIFKDENGKTTGDVYFEKVAKHTSFITPTPGGVGPMTIASLMLNTVELFEQNL